MLETQWGAWAKGLEFDCMLLLTFTVKVSAWQEWGDKRLCMIPGLMSASVQSFVHLYVFALTLVADKRLHVPNPGGPCRHSRPHVNLY